MKIELGKTYKDQDGVVWEILDSRNPYKDSYPFVGVKIKTGWIEPFSEIGQCWGHNIVLVEECKYPLKGQAWVNVYNDEYIGIVTRTFQTKEEADENPFLYEKNERIACVCIDWKELLVSALTGKKGGGL